MLFFQLDFLFLFLLPLTTAAALLLCVPGIAPALPLLAAAASVIFLYQHSEMSVYVALASLTMNFLAARYFLRNKTRSVFIAIIAVNLAVLGYFKYSILIDNTLFDGNLPLTWRLALPLGVSFYTFQQIAFVSDVYRGKVRSFSLRTYLIFKLFFPQFIAGPIVHFERVRASYERWPTFNPDRSSSV